MGVGFYFFFLDDFFFDDDFLVADFFEVDDLDDDTPELPFAGILIVSPARSLSEVMPLAFLISSIDTPYRFDRTVRLSPF